MVCRHLHRGDRPWPVVAGVGAFAPLQKSHATGKSAWDSAMKAIFTFLVFVSVAPAFAAGLTRPASGKGADAKTLLVYTDTRAQYSMSEGIEVLRLQLRRVATQLESVAVSNAT